MTMAVTLVGAYFLGYVLREYTAITWWQVLIVDVAVWMLGTVAWWWRNIQPWELREKK